MIEEVSESRSPSTNRCGSAEVASSHLCSRNRNYQRRTRASRTRTPRMKLCNAGASMVLPLDHAKRESFHRFTIESTLPGMALPSSCDQGWPKQQRAERFWHHLGTEGTSHQSSSRSVVRVLSCPKALANVRLLLRAWKHDQGAMGAGGEGGEGEGAQKH